MLLAGKEGTPYREIVLGRAAPGVDDQTVPTMVMEPIPTRRQGILSTVDAAAYHMTHAATNVNTHFPSIRGIIDFRTALTRELVDYQRGLEKAKKEDSGDSEKGSVSLYAVLSTDEQVIKSGVEIKDPDYMREPDNDLAELKAVTEVLLFDAAKRYPEFFPKKKVVEKDTYVNDPGGDKKDRDSDAAFRQALQARIAEREKGVQA